MRDVTMLGAECTRVGWRGRHIGRVLARLVGAFLGGGAVVVMASIAPVSAQPPGASATRLPDGRTLVVGEPGPDAAAPARVDDPAGPRTVVAGLATRTRHAALLLADGTVLLAGGVGADGQPLESAERWDPLTGTTTPVAGTVPPSRVGHTATRWPDGRVWIAATPRAGPRAPGALYDPATDALQRWADAPPAPAAPAGPPVVRLASPTIDAPLDRPLAWRASAPLRPESVTAASVTLQSPAGPVPARIVPSDDGRLVFVAPDAPLAPGTAYTVTAQGWLDAAGGAVPAATARLATLAVPGLAAAPRQAEPADGIWTPDMARGLAGWRLDRPPSPWAALPALRDRPGSTALSGQVLTIWGEPLRGVALSIDQQRTRTDATGRFLLGPLDPGRHELLIDGGPAQEPGRTYGVFEVGVDLAAGETTVLGYTIWLTPLDTAHTVRFPSPTDGEVVITTPRVPGLEVHLPPGAVVTDHRGQALRELGLTPIPLDRPPFPLPPDVNPPAYFTVQPGAGYVTSPTGGARIVYPNRFGYPPGAGHSFWHYDAEEGWYVYGLGHVTPDGAQVVPDPGVSVYEFTGAMVGAGQPVPIVGPVPCDRNPSGWCVRVGDPVDPGTGQFVLTKTEVVLPGPLPLVFQRTYRAGDADVRPFGRGSTHNFALFVRSNPGFQDGDLILPDGGRVHLVRTNTGSGAYDGIFTHTETPTAWAGLDLRYATDHWVLTRRDGFVYEFEPTWGNLRALRDRFGNWLRITIGGGQANLSRIEASNGRWLAFTYVGGGTTKIETITDNLGRTWTYAYDPGGQWLQTVTDPEGGVTEYTYDYTLSAGFRMVTLKDARGIVFLTNEYDANHRVIRQTQADSTTFQLAYTLDAQGRVTQTDVTDPRGLVRRLTFSAAGYLLTDTRALGQPAQQTTTLERQAGSNFVTAQTDALGRRTEFQYDAKGNLTQVTRLAGTAQAVTTAFTYEPTFSQVTSVTDPLTHTTTFGYDARGALTTITDPLSHATTLTPDATGQPTAITDGLSHTTQLGYDAGDLVSVTDPLGQVTRRFLDGAGRVVQVTDPLGQATRYAYDRLNRLTTVQDAQGGTTGFAYDPNGNLLTVTDAASRQTTYTYNTMDRLATRTDPLTHAESYQYDANGNLTQVTDRKSQVTTFTYDGLDRRTVTTYPGAVTVTATYDAGHRVTQLADTAAGTISRTWDGLDRLTQETTPQGTVGYTYDAASRRATMTVAGQSAVGYTYDNADRLTQVAQGSQTVGLTYDNANRRATLTLPNGVVLTYAYDTADRLTGLTYALGGTTLGALTYSPDAAGNRTAIGGSWARTNLPAAVATTSYNANHQQLTFGGATMTYDLNGNLATLASGGNTTTYTWNPRNQLTGLSGPGLTASFGYDALGRRWTKTVNVAQTDFLYDGLNPVQEGALPTTPSANLLTGLGLDEFFTRTDAAGLRAFLTDALGSTVALTSTSGAVQTEYTYAPFGETTAAGAASTNPFQFAGRENDGTGLHYYRARYYHPASTRFVSEDPVRWGEGANYYTYVWNGPVNLVDPLGLTPFRNNSGRPIPYKPEHGDNVLGVCPSGTWCNVDGVYSPADSNRQCAIKIPDNCFAWANPQGELRVMCLLVKYLGGPSVVTPATFQSDPFKNWPDPYGPSPEWPYARWDPGRTCGCTP